ICPCPAWHTCPPPPLPAPQLPEFEQRVAVLQQLGYLAEDRSVTLKGRVCCEIQSTQDELVATEAVFSGLLGELSPEEAVALLSALVFQEKSEVEPRLPPALSAAREALVALTASTAALQRDAGLDIAPDQHCADVLHCGLMEVRLTDCPTDGRTDGLGKRGGGGLHRVAAGVSFVRVRVHVYGASDRHRPTVYGVRCTVSIGSTVQFNRQITD
ncbi:hypothetical protein Vretimale_6108, partial [Volvox reticuliferus]